MIHKFRFARFELNRILIGRCCQNIQVLILITTTTHHVEKWRIIMEVFTLIFAILLFELLTHWTNYALSKSLVVGLSIGFIESSSDSQKLVSEFSENSAVTIIEKSNQDSNIPLTEGRRIYLDRNCEEGIRSIQADVENINQQIRIHSQTFSKYKIDTLMKTLNFRIKVSEKIIKLIEKKNQKVGNKFFYLVVENKKVFLLEVRD